MKPEIEAFLQRWVDSLSPILPRLQALAREFEEDPGADDDPGAEEVE